MPCKPAFIPVALLACVAALHSAEPNATFTAGTIYQRAATSVVLVQAYNVFGNAQMFGTGFVITYDGKILTNYHVIRGAKRIEIRAANGHTYSSVAVLGFDAGKDVALLQMKPAELEPLGLGNTEAVHIGDAVFSVSNANGYNNTLSEGIVSGIRMIAGHRRLQVTAPISHGSSGGPLFNSDGVVIGLTTEIDEKGQNINFVVPMEDGLELLITSQKQSARSNASASSNPALLLVNSVWTPQNQNAIANCTILFLTCWFMGRVVRKVWRMNNRPRAERTSFVKKAWLRFALPVLLCTAIAVVMVSEIAAMLPQ